MNSRRFSSESREKAIVRRCRRYPQMSQESKICVHLRHLRTKIPHFLHKPQPRSGILVRTAWPAKCRRFDLLAWSKPSRWQVMMTNVECNIGSRISAIYSFNANCLAPRHFSQCVYYEAFTRFVHYCWRRSPEFFGTAIANYTFWDGGSGDLPKTASPRRNRCPNRRPKEPQTVIMRGFPITHPLTTEKRENFSIWRRTL